MRKSKGRRWFFQWTFMILLNLPVIIHCQKQKRQIFREQVLPALGGKIPEEAFRTDRLALNRLNKEGITVVDGVILAARHADKHPTYARAEPEVIKVYATVDNRYVSPEGRYHHDHPRTVDTTYVIRKPYGSSGQSVSGANHRDSAYLPAAGYVNFHQQIPTSIPPVIQSHTYKPVIRPLILPSHDILFSGFYDPAWNHPHAFDWSGSRLPDDTFETSGTFSEFDSSQGAPNDDRFLDAFHYRTFRRSDNPSHVANSVTNASKPTDGSEKASFRVLSPSTGIPETGFSCQGRKGTFADPETDCQVFHECTGWRKTSSKCPPETAYSEELKRCEWAHQVKCRE